MTDTSIYLGRLGSLTTPGSLLVVPHPREVLQSTRARLLDVFELGAGGARVDQMVGGARTYTLPYNGLTMATFARLQAYADGHEGPGPFVFLDPGQRNMLPVDMSAATSNTNGTDAFAVTGTGCVIGSSSLITDAGPRTLRWTFNSAAPGSGAALTPVWPSSTFAYGIPVVLGRPICFSAYVRGGGIDQIVTYTPQIVWRTADGTVVSTTSGSTLTSDNVDFVRGFVTGTPPATAVFADWKIAYTSGASSGAIGFWRRFMVNEGSTPDTSWVPGTGVWPVKVLNLEEGWLGRFPDFRSGPQFVLQEDTS